MTRRPIERSERIGPYRLVEMIAHGATSCVLGGFYDGPAGFSLPVAIKTLRGDALRSPAHVRDFVFEARAAARIVHPGVASIHALLEEVGLPLLVMERVSGWSLRAVCATLTLTRRRIEHAIAAALVRDAAHAAHALHEGGVIHRNLCPENLLVSASGHVKVIDFGAASWDATEQVRGRPRPVIDPAYAAPETPIGVRGNRPGDVYTLGAVLHELCFGVPPPAPSGRATSPRLPDTVPDGLGAVIERALRYDADERFVTAADLAEALDDVAVDHGWRASPTIVAAHVSSAFTTRIVVAPRARRRAPSDVGRTRVRLRRARA